MKVARQNRMVTSLLTSGDPMTSSNSDVNGCGHEFTLRGLVYIFTDGFYGIASVTHKMRSADLPTHVS